MDYIALAIPVFFLLIGIEILAARRQHRKLYRLNDALNDLSCGILQQVLGAFTKVIVFGVYVALYEYRHLLEIGHGSAAAWVACFLGVDLAYYWFHRISHESNLPWGAHIVHHQSEEYNLAVALRQGAFQPLFSWIFYLPLAWLGFPPLMFLTCSSFNTLYQFWIHTRTIGKLGVLEWFLNTPSHHRVHHGCNDKYLDKNYAGVFIIWDRMFGSFQAEEEEPTYGITKPLRSWNPLWANVHYYADLWRLARRAPSWREKLKVWLMPPAWKPEWAPEGPGARPPVSPLSHGEAGKYDAVAPPGLVAYAVVHFASLIAATVLLLFLGDALATWAKAAIAVWIAWTAAGVGAVFERRPWLLLSELARLAATALLAVALLRHGGPRTVVLATLAGAAFFSLCATWLLRHRQAFTAPAERS